ncbi:MAG: hypothetical protein HC828_21650 [Blastochloris sp.]|nr:hypothetical protein [Blastochloris sp.]
MPTAEKVIAQLRTSTNFMPSFSPAQVSDDEARLIAEFLAEEFSAVQTAPATLPQSGARREKLLKLLTLGSAGARASLIDELCHHQLARFLPQPADEPAGLGC